jgi:UDP-2,4-diacetamido-2,4,6-trideoxy-beta-L-altropyranose hydrolase
LTSQKIILRADANHQIGLGHVSRCLALGEALSGEFQIAFAIHKPDARLLDTIATVCKEVIQLQRPESPEELKSHLSGSEIVVLDGYDFEGNYEEAIRTRAAGVVTIDDIHRRHFCADIIINFCGAVKTAEYSKEPHTSLYLGLDHLFLRRPFLTKPPSLKKAVMRVLVNMGGSDPENHTAGVVRDIMSKGYTGEIIVVVGGLFRFREELEHIAQGRNNVRILQALSPLEMYELMLECPIAILPPSTVALEYLSTGGVLFLNQTADNQSCLKTFFLQQLLAFETAAFLELVVNGSLETLLTAQFARLHSMFDGASHDRLKRLFAGLALGARMVFRRAEERDTRTCFEIASDPEARRFSYSKKSISWEEHVKWFANKIGDENCFYFISELENEVAGQIRFDQSGDNTFVISYVVASAWRSRGLGSRLLMNGIRHFMTYGRATRLVGYVQAANVSSVRIFERAGFVKYIADEYPDSYRFELAV